MDYKLEAQKREQDIVSDLKNIVSIKSIYNEETIQENAPFGADVREALDQFLEMAKRDGFEHGDIDGYAGYIEFGEGEELVGVLGHLDVVPLGEGWNFDPLGKDEKDGYLFGRGMSDDKGPTIAAYHAIKMLKDNNVTLNRRVRLIVGCDEETGFRCMEYYKKHAEIPAYGFVPDANFPVIYGEKGIVQAHLNSNYNTVITALNAGEVGNVVIGRASVTVDGDIFEEAFNQFLNDHDLKGHVEENGYYVEGKPAHAMEPHMGKNAGVYLLQFIAEQYDDEYAKVLHSLLHSYHGHGLNIDFEGKYMGPLTMNVGVLRIESNKQSALIDMRIPDGMEAETVFENIKKTVTPLNIEFDVVEDKDKVFLDPKGEMIQILEGVYREHTNDHTSPLITMGGGTYAKAFENHVAYGMEFPLENKPEIVGDIHSADEAISRKALIDGTAIYADAIVKLCNM